MSVDTSKENLAVNPITRFLTSATKNLLSPIKFRDGLVLRLSLDKEVSRFVAHFVDSEGNDSYLGYELSVFLNRFPEKKRLSDSRDKWLFSGTDITALLIYNVWENAGMHIEWLDENAKVFYRTLILRYCVQIENAEAIAKYKEHKLVDKASWFLDNKKDSGLELTQYQKVAALCSLRSESFALHMDMGTGKTPVAIAVMCNDALRLFRKRLYRFLVVCPKNVRMNWVEEIKRFATIKGKITTLRGDKIARMKLLIQAMIKDEEDELYSAVLVSYDTMSRMVEALKIIEWDLTVLDESHSIALPSTNRSKASLKLRDSCKRRIELTGTPIRNTPLDLYSQLEFLGNGFSGFQSAKNFKNFYGVWQPVTNNGQNTGQEILTGLQNLPFIKERLARLTFRVSKKEALPDLPDKIYDITEVEMSDEQTNAYKELQEHLAIEIQHEMEGMKAETRSLVINNILTKLLRLAQITSGFMVLDEVCDLDGTVLVPRTIKRFDPNPKLDEMMELLEGKRDNEKTIIWACWIADIEAIENRLHSCGRNYVSYHGRIKDNIRDENVRSFNEDREMQYFVANPGAGGVGLNLIGYPPGREDEYDTNCTHVIYYSGDWSQVKRTQSEDRVHRRGTREPIRITDLCVPGTIDEEIRARVFKKRKMALEITDIHDIVKNILKGLDE